MVLTNYSLPITLYITPIRFALEWVALLYALVRLDINHVLGIFQSFGWIITHPHIIWKRRRHTKRIRKVKDKDVLPWIYCGSVVFDYYIRRKKRSADIVKE